MNSWSTQVWHAIKTDQKLAFIRSCRGLNGANVKGRMKKFVIIAVPSTLTTFAGLWMDSPDLKSKYKNKPEQWKALREHTYQFVSLVQGFEAVENGDMQKHVKAAKAV